MPLHHHIEGCHGAREPGVEIRPPAVHHPLEMAHHGQHGEHRLHQHTVLPLATVTEVEVAGSPSAAWKPVSLKTIMRPSTCRMSHRKVLSCTFAVAQSHQIPKPYWFNKRHNFPPTIQR